MNSGLQFRSLQFGQKQSTPPTQTVTSDDVLSKFTPEQQQKLERFAKNARSIVTHAVEAMKVELQQLPGITYVKNEQEREEMVNSLFFARFGKSPSQFEQVMFGNAVSKFMEVL